jgi:hypothetical protein
MALTYAARRSIVFHAVFHRRLAGETIDLLAREGELIKQHMITHVIPFEDAPEFLSDLLQRRFEFLQIVFKVGP